MEFVFELLFEIFGELLLQIAFVFSAARAQNRAGRYLKPARTPAARRSAQTPRPG